MGDATRLTDERLNELIERNWPLTAPERRSLLAELQSRRAQSEGAQAKVVERAGVIEEVRHALDREFENGSPPETWDASERAVERCRETVNEVCAALSPPWQTEEKAHE